MSSSNGTSFPSLIERPTITSESRIMPTPSSASCSSASALVELALPETSTWRTPPLRLERPAAQVRRVGHAEAIVRQEVVGLLRRAVAAQVRGRGAHHALDLADPARHERGVHQRAQADAQVGALLDQVDHAVGDGELDLHLGVARKEVRQRRRELVHAERGADVHAQQPARLGAEARDLVLRLGDVGEDALAAMEIGLALGCQGEPARRAIEQAHAEAVLQARHQLGDRRGREAEVARGDGKAAQLDRAHEGGHIARATHLCRFFTDVVPF